MTAPGWRRPRDESGMATFAVLSLVGVVLVVAMAAAAALGAAVAHRRAQAAADLASLAAATADGWGQAACVTADDVAQANGAALTSCTRQGSDVLVSVAVDVPGAAGLLGEVEARARAGPS